MFRVPEPTAELLDVPELLDDALKSGAVRRVLGPAALHEVNVSLQAAKLKGERAGRA